MGIGRAVDTVKARTVAGEPEGRLPEVEQMASLVQQDANYSKALDVFTFAAERADAYLKPRVLYQKAFLHLNAGAYEEAEGLFSSIERIAPNESMLQPQMDKLRAGMAEIKGLRRQRDSEKKGEAIK